MMDHQSPLVIYYHSVAPKPFEGWPLRFLTMDLARFERQMEHVVQRRWDSVFLDEWWNLRNGRTPARGKALCITFDDGLLDNWVYAFPIVRKHGLKMTLFVCPELIERTDRVRPNLENVWKGECDAEKLIGLGHLSWGELRAMQRSGHVDVQSHTMSHAKYIVSDSLRAIYYGGFEGYYPLLNTLSAEEKPRYMDTPDFGQRMPLGTPLFEEASSVVARKRVIDPGFLEEAGRLASQHDLSIFQERPAYERRMRELYRRRMSQGGLVREEESFTEQVERIEYEIIASKRVLEKELDKPVRFLCWPHGGNSDGTHAIAKEAGYAATTVGRMHVRRGALDRIPRVGTDWRMAPAYARLKFDYKMGAHHRTQPYRAFWEVNDLKNTLLGRH